MTTVTLETAETISMKEWCQTGASKPQPPDYQSDMQMTEPPGLAPDDI